MVGNTPVQEPACCLTLLGKEIPLLFWCVYRAGKVPNWAQKICQVRRTGFRLQLCPFFCHCRQTGHPSSLSLRFSCLQTGNCYCQLDSNWNHLGGKPVSMPVISLCIGLVEVRRHTLMWVVSSHGLGFWIGKEKSELSTLIHLSLCPDCRSNVASYLDLCHSFYGLYLQNCDSK